MLSDVKLTILCENRVKDPQLIAEQGLSIFVETPEGNILFDSGQTDTLLQNAETLDIKYRGKSIFDVLKMSFHQALEFFDSFPNLKRTIKTVVDVGLGYLELGQSSTTLSGGESQRLKIARELRKTSTGNTLYILDEPTTGLSSFDINYLLKVLQKLVDKGNTVIIIEHNMDIVKYVKK